MNRRQSHAAKRFEECRLLFYGLVSKFCKSFGEDFEETVSEASELFMLILGTHDPNRQCLQADLRFRLWKMMLSRRRQRYRTKSRLSLIEVDFSKIDSRSIQDQELEVDFRSLNEDAIEVVRLIFESYELTEDSRGADGVVVPSLVKRALKKHFTRKGWTRRKLDSAFQQIQEVLT